MINEDHSIQVIAKVRIEAGQEITNQYMKADKPTIIRRTFLRQKWFFNCVCCRCSDPTECGSHLSSILCHKCGGAVVPANCLDSQSDWSCLQCEAVVCLDKVQAVLEKAGQLIDTPAEDDCGVEHCERALHQLSTQLHPHNYLLIDVKQKLAMLYGNTTEYNMVEMGRPAKQRKMQLCLDVMDCLSKIEIGYNTWRTKMLSELSRTKVAMARQDFSSGKLSEAGMKAVMMENKFLMMYLAYQQAAVV